MSAQRLSEKTTRRLSRTIGMEVVRAWAHGGYVYDFVVASENRFRHLHGWYDKKTGEWALRDETYRGHYDTCYSELFPPSAAVQP